MVLNQTEWDLLHVVEQEFLANGQVPSAERLAGFGLASVPYCEKFYSNADVRNSLLARGIRINGSNGVDQGILTEEQLTVANIMLDFRDNRSQKKKLSDLKISTQKWEAWLRDPAFKDYLRTRAEGILGDNQHEAAIALVDRVRSGDTNAIKFYYEITGRYVPQSGNSFDVPALLMRVLEIIQKHVHDDLVLGAISDDLITLASGVGLVVSGNKSNFVRGSQVKQLEGNIIDI